MGNLSQLFEILNETYWSRSFLEARSKVTPLFVERLYKEPKKSSQKLCITQSSSDSLIPIIIDTISPNEDMKLIIN